MKRRSNWFILSLVIVSILISLCGCKPEKKRDERFIAKTSQEVNNG